MKRFVAILTIFVLALVFTPVQTGTNAQCEFDHRASTPSINTTVHSCKNLTHNGETLAGLSAKGNVYVVVGPNSPEVYLHELGHEMGYGHNRGTLMHPRVQEEIDCSVSDIERDIATSWNTTSVDSIGPCEYVNTPYGKNF